MAVYKVAYYCLSDIGKARQINQDNFIADGAYLRNHDAHMPAPLSGEFDGKTPLLLGIFDGMGGEESGETASLIASECAAKADLSDDPIEGLLNLCQNANYHICEFARENGISSMGTTGAMLAFTKDGIALCNIGDSRIFRLAEGQLTQISVDHTAPFSVGGKPPLSQNLGIPPEELRIEPYVARGQYQNGDIFLICSDGLTDMVSTEEITDILSGTDFDMAVKRLVDTAIKNGGRDNVTVIVCRVKKKRWSLFG